MKHTLENDFFKIVIEDKGAELQQLLHKETGIDYMWNGDAVFWGKHSPVLFPIVGALKDNSYYVQGTSYQMERHGFARTMDFVLTETTPASISFSLSSSADTLRLYPFEFLLIVKYTLLYNGVQVSYEVKNIGNDSLWFSIGAHPAFRVPIFEGTQYDDYELKFADTESAGKWPIEAGGLIAGQSIPFLEKTAILPLKKELFYKDALVFKNIRSRKISLQHKDTKRGFSFAYDDFPYLGIWAAKDANFVCIEPWCGIADSVYTNQDFTQKEGINKLDPQVTFIRSWSVTII